MFSEVGSCTLSAQKSAADCPLARHKSLRSIQTSSLVMRKSLRPDFGSRLDVARASHTRACSRVFDRPKGWEGTRDDATAHVAFRNPEPRRRPRILNFTAQYLARACPCQRFVSALTGRDASLGVTVVRYTFGVKLLHLLHSCRFIPAHSEC